MEKIWKWPTIPYPGLRSFEISEEHDESLIFFGRKKQTYELINRLAKSHFVAVLGPSGCGKSSLVRVGLIPHLESGYLHRAGSRWRSTIMEPGSKPIIALARALSNASVNVSDSEETGQSTISTSDFVKRLYERPDALVKLIEETPPIFGEKTNLLILVDQFEELFREDLASPSEATRLINLILNVFYARPDRLYIVTTMRTDYIEQCAYYMGLPEALNQTQYLTPRLNSEELREAIVKPVRLEQFNGNIENEIVQRLLDEMTEEVTYDPDRLPLMQHALMRMWQTAKQRAEKNNGIPKIKLEDYKNFENLKDCLSKHSDEIYKNLSNTQQKIAEIMFRLLCGLETGGQPIRRTTTLEEIAAVGKFKRDEIIPVSKRFTSKENCFVRWKDERTKLDITHESLIRQWEKMGEWADAEAKSASDYSRLEEKAREWKNNGKSKEWLEPMPHLQISLDWKERENPTHAWAERYKKDFNLAMEFLEVSEKEFERKKIAEKEAEEKEHQLKIDKERQEKELAKERAEKAEQKEELSKQRAESAEREKELEEERAKATRNKLFSIIILIIVLVLLLFAYPEFTINRYNNFIKLGNTSNTNKKYKKAVNHYRKAIDWKSDNPNAYLSLGNALNYLEEYDKAIKNFKKGIEIAPKYPELLESLGYAYFKKNDYSEAINSFKEAEKLNTEKSNDNVYTYNMVGYELIGQKRLDDAIEYFKKAIEIDPQNIEAYLIVGNELLNQGKEDKAAIEYFKKAIKIAPDKVDVNVYTIVGNALLKQSKESEAINYYKKAIEIEPNNLDVTIKLGDAYYRQKMEDDAIEYYKKAIEMALDMVNIETYKNVSKILYEQGKEDEADKYNKIAEEIKDKKKIRMDEFKNRVRKIDSDNYIDFVAKGNALLNQGNEDEAIGYFKKAIVLAPDKINVTVYTTVGYALLKQGKEVEAINSFKKSINMTPDNKIDVNACRIVGNALLKDNDKEAEAIIYYKKALDFVKTYPSQNKGFSIDAFQADIEKRLREHRKTDEEVNKIIRKVGFDS